MRITILFLMLSCAVQAQTVLTKKDIDANPGITVGASSFAVDNSSIVFNESGIDVDFRAEGVGEANALFVQGSDGFVGVGTGAPGMQLDVSGTARIQGANNSRVEIWAGSANGGLSLGADVNAVTRSTNVRKVGVISSPDYANTANIEIFSLNSPDANTNTVSFGGRSGGSNTGATELNFITNATPATTGGTIRMKMTSVGNIKIAGTAVRGTTEGTNHLDIFDGTAPAGTLTNGVSFYSASGEARVMDAAGNSTLLSPHEPDTNEWIYYSKNTKTGKVLKIRMEALMKALNERLGADFIEEYFEEPEIDCRTEYLETLKN